MQTTVNDIASLFMGNPGALQNRIQKEQQAKPGIPPDLKELLALQQIQEQLQAAQQQQALQNPQNQPTVAQSLQQAAKQALMARQVQAQQMQMAKEGQMGLPQGLPQPQHQPQMGLDQIQSNLGEYYGGGIVAFKEGDLVEKIPGQSDYVAPEGEKIDSSELERNIRNTILASGASISRLATPARQALALLSEAFHRGSPKSESVSNNQKDGGNAPTAEEIEAASKPYIGYRSPPRLAGQEPKKYQESLPDYTNDLAPGMRAGQPIIEAPPKPPKPRPPGLPGSPRLQTLEKPKQEEPAKSEPDQPTPTQAALAAIAGMDPAAIEAERRKQYESEVGKPQFQEERELIKELQTRRANIGKGTNPLLDLLEGIATSAPGRGGILSQGAEGVRNARAMQQQREQQNMDMLKEILGQQKTITSGERAYKENLFALGKKVYDETFAQRFEALKAQGMDERQARLIASEEAKAKQRLMFDREQLTSQERRHRETIAAGREPSGDFLAFKNEPETYKKYMEARNPAAANQGQMRRDQAEDNFRKDMENFQIAEAYKKEATEALKKQGIQNPTMSDIKEYFIQKMMKGSPYAQKTGASGGSTAVYNWNDISNPPK
jgi:hypothetical protein